MIFIKDIGMSVRTFNVLYRKKIKTLEELTSYSGFEVAAFRGMGPKSFKEIIDILNEYGLALRSHEYSSIDEEFEKLSKDIKMARLRIRDEYEMIDKTKKRLKEIKRIKRGS